MPSSNLSLKFWPNPILRIKCEEAPIEAGIGEEMIELMMLHRGVGLSAPQVGLTSRIFVMRDPDNNEAGLVFANPEIVDHSSDVYEDFEGCLSIPGQRVKIKRFKVVDVEFDAYNKRDLPIGDDRLTWRFEGLHARCIQHEIDHLNGIMIFDHINSNLGQKMFLDKYAKIRKKYARLG